MNSGGTAGRRALQVATAILAVVPTVSGLVAMTGLADPLYAHLSLPHDATLDSNLRFYAGVWMGLGLAAFWVVPRIERETVLFRALWLMIFIGGIGRAASLFAVGLPFLPFVGFTALEVIGAPLFIWWQHRVALAASRRRP
ncbi:DUF4345 domain-containing protein [Paraburkholderia sp. G-4-1-8]|uniref:DUF4345 domain-containing protein n=2 Tax=Paraburkholderia antibiotica TaxID=2728839 RepID=A0A7Y0A0C4_9BURK|nr:DUF4345 domain-containing protein [Paraburkholderia antibiotica]